MLEKTNIKINAREEIKHKLSQRTLTKKDWNIIGQDKLLQTTVLDDIFRKYVDYQDLRKRHHTETKSQMSHLTSGKKVTASKKP